MFDLKQGSLVTVRFRKMVGEPPTARYKYIKTSPTIQPKTGSARLAEVPRPQGARNFDFLYTEASVDLWEAPVKRKT